MDFKSNLPTIAYFSMEIALEPDIPTYSGGLGVLAGDTLRSAADMLVPIVATTLVYRKGYFRQHLDPDGNQHEAPQQWDPATQLQLTDAQAKVTIEGRQVTVRAWRYDVRGYTGGVVNGPAIGFLARAVGLTGALGLVGAAALVIALLGPRLGSAR